MAYKDKDVGAELSVGDLKMSSQASAGAVNGGWVKVDDDTAGLFASAIAAAMLGNVTGAPSAASLAVKIQDAVDGSGTGAADYKPDGVNVAQSVAGIAVNSPDANTHQLAKLKVDLRNSRGWVRAVGTLGFTAGTAPKADVVLGLVMGGPTNAPTADQNA